jgi:hypothetical protein
MSRLALAHAILRGLAAVLALGALGAVAYATALRRPVPVYVYHQPAPIELHVLTMVWGALAPIFSIVL